MPHNKNKYYIYRHIRLDTNQVFYIGRGTGNRAQSKKYRNKHWMAVVGAAGYEIEIMIDGLSCCEANRKEREFIELYGRRDLGTGTLVNMTNGGDGISGYKFSNESIERLKASHIGIRHSEKSKDKMRMRKMPVRTKAALSKYLPGHIMSLEARTRLSNSMKGNTNGRHKAKFTSEEIINLKNRIKQGEKISALAKEFLVSKPTIYRSINRV